MRVFIKKCVTWLSGFVKWKKEQLKQILRKHISWYDDRIVIADARNKLMLEQHKKYRDVCGVIEYCRRTGQPVMTVREKGMAYVSRPECFEGEKEVVFEYQHPEIYLAELSDADVYGYSELITSGGTALSDAYMYDCKQRRYNIGGGSLAKHQTGKYILATYNESGIVIEKAISLLGWRPDNYYHFTLEIISRLPFADEIEEYRNWPVLIDECVMRIPQLRDLTAGMNKLGHPIIEVKPRQAVRVKRLLYISYDMWMPHNYRAGAKQYPSDYLFSASVTSNIRKYLFEKYPIPEKPQNLRVFLSRKKCGNQRLLNADKVEAFFAGKGFTIIYPEELSFAEEVQLFQNACLIVGPTGAALTNLIYCRENTTVAIIAPESHRSYFFSNIAYLVKARFLFLGANIVEKGIAESMDTFELDMEKCERFVNSDICNGALQQADQKRGEL